MFKKLLQSDLDYIRCFSQEEENEDFIRFWDNQLPEMYCHNFVYLKREPSRDELVRLVTEGIERARINDTGFFQVEAGFRINSDFFEFLPARAEVSVYDYMYISTGKFDDLRGNAGCEVREAVEPEILQDGIKVDLEASIPGMGRAFATERINRKAKAYNTQGNGLSFLVCYYRGEPIGKCDLFVHNGFAKVEDFDILERHQRKGFGTAVLKQAMKLAYERGAGTTYVVTDSEDTAKDMYAKCGFTKAGQKTVLFFKI